MIDLLLYTFPLLILVLSIGHYVKPHRTYPPTLSTEGLPDLRLAHLPKKVQVFLDTDAKERKRRERETEHFQRMQEYKKQMALTEHEARIAKRVEAWKRGEPNQGLSEVRAPTRINEMSQMSRYYYSPQMGRPYRNGSYMEDL